MNHRAAAGVAFATAFVTLFTQVLICRVVSAKLLNNYAFLIISLTLLGFAVSGAWLTGRAHRFVGPGAGDGVQLSAALFAVSLVLVTVLFYRADAGLQMPHTRTEFLAGFVRAMPLAMGFSVPFIFCGLILGALLAAPGLPAGMVYGADLIGSAAGALAVVPAITHLGVERALLVAAAALPAVVAVLLWPRGRTVRAALGAAVLVAAVGAARREELFAMRYPSDSMLANTGRPGSSWVIERVMWDPLSRLELSRVPMPDPRTFGYASLIGDDPEFLSRCRKMLTQNNFAFTMAPDYDGRSSSLRGIDRTLYAAAYHATSVPHPRVLAIGVGGGMDVLAALGHGASEVTGVEVNGAVVETLTRAERDYFRPWVGDPRVRLVHADGRNELCRTDAAFDVIQLSGVDTYSGTPGAAHVFSESYLYTAEACDLYLSRLTPSGVLNLMRLEYRPPREMLRVLTTVVAALRRAGSPRPSDQILMLTADKGYFAALLVKKTPFTPAERARLAAWAAGSRYFFVSADPALNGRGENLYQIFLAPGSAEAEREFIANYPFDIAPATDDRPFFFRHSFWRHLVRGDRAVRASIPAMEMSVAGLLLLLGTAAVLCVALPLRFLAGRGIRMAGVWRRGAFFGGLGLGYLAVEVAFLQKFGLLLGHPNYALSVVLAALLLSSGAGALLAGRAPAIAGRLRPAGRVACGLLLLEAWVFLPMLPLAAGLPFWPRCAIVVALVAPVGLCLGVFMPAGLERLKQSAPKFVPWAWGINGICSVLAPVLAVALSATVGLTALLVAAAFVYLAVGETAAGV